MSRRAAEEEIKAGRVTVNGETAVPGTTVDPASDVVKINGRQIQPRGGRRYTYVMLNKPAGFVTTMSDDRGRRCAAELVSDVGCRVYPIGRLDYESEGLLLFTDDGALANKLMHPSGHIPKIYHVKTDSEVDEASLKKLTSPMMIDGYKIRPAECSVVTMKDGYTVLSVTLYEGRNRQIRKMFEQVGLNVVTLKRIAIGEIRLGNLKRGEWRKLSAAQIKYLKDR